jgi:uncharacterized Fe-S cluster-containing radical SAM superfamily protein
MLELPFDPIQHSLDVEKVVMRGGSRRYYRFRYAKFYGGIATADAVGCNLLCAYCWNYSRNLEPSNAGAFYTPEKVATRLKAIAEKRDCDQYRISGAEPILGTASVDHLVDVIRRIDGSFIVETNGLMLGYDASLVDALSPPPVHVRLCIKAHSSLNFEKITGARAEYFLYQIKAAENLRDARISHSIAVMSPFVDPSKLPIPVDEVEDLILYKSIVGNLKRRGFELDRL